MPRRPVMGLVALALSAPLALGGVPADAAPAAPAPAPTRPARPYDVDGNTHPDLVVGADGLRVGGRDYVGGVVVLPASKQKGISSAAAVVVPNPTPPPPGYGSDGFGRNLTSADFNRDGYADLAVSAANGFAGTVQSGAVVVFSGSPRGLDTAHPVRLTLPDLAEGSWFGGALAAGDLTGDGFADLVVSAPNERVGPPDAYPTPVGAVRVFRGGPGGLAPTPVATLSGDLGPQRFDRYFGWSVAVGDVDRDGDVDLVVGSFGPGDPGDPYPGSLSYCDGRPGGPRSCVRLLQSTALATLAAVALGDVSGGPGLEIVVGVPHRDGPDPGAVLLVELVPGHPDRVARVKTLTKDSRGVPGSNADLDDFGCSLAIGDLDRDGHADLVIGADEARSGRGRVVVVHGAPGGWRSSDITAYSQDTRGVPGHGEADDGFGSALTLLDHDGDGRLELSVGSPGEDRYAGAVTTLRGSRHGLTTSGARMRTLAGLGYARPGYATFGSALGG